ncbi:rust resistance kinase Lr10-like [Salvia splendens]|uniref:rust resistance kinase Lr10-like n=1 Tax=Salvia splendens TaxID=180675 RepID=UPI001C26BF0D|nr:rust resistance kinase Lr10-like [Salvia splendens]
MQGGINSVYKGKFRSGHLVAIKSLEKSAASGQDFINEIATIGRIHHIEVEVARGVEYLHYGCDIQILHFDFKPHNILLNDKFVPKISDFGLAKLCATNKEAVTLTAARGTIGYVAPELINRSIGRVSYKADVYSFGMLLMEMVNLNKDLTRNNDESSKYFPHWIYDHLNKDKDIDIGNDNETDDKNIGRKMTMVALWCIQMSSDNRPSMNKVLKMLEVDVEQLHIPNYSAYMAGNEEENWVTNSNVSISLHDINDSSIIEIISIA